MDTNRETYRQWMLGQIQLWESEIADLRSRVEKLDGGERFEGRRLVGELDKRQRELFGNYEDLMLAGETDWEQHRVAVDAAAAKVQDLLYWYRPESPRHPIRKRRIPYPARNYSRWMFDTR